MKNNAEITYKYIMPTRIVTENNSEKGAVLLTKSPRQALLNDAETAVIHDGGYIVLDFGRELHGGVNITSYGGNNTTKLRLTFGESVSEALSSVGEKGAVNDHALRDYEIAIPYHNGNFETGCTGFRFVRLTAVGGDLQIGGIEAKLVYRDLEYYGSFECNDEKLNEIWKTGAYTVQLNMQEYIWDGVKRDRLVWIGDMHPEVSSILSVFGEADVVKKSLELVKDSTPTGKWANGIPSYSMWWIIIQRDWYNATGDEDFIKRNSEYTFNLLEYILICAKKGFTADGGLDNWFVDWSSNETEAMETGFCSVLILALNAGADLCRYLNNAELVGKIEAVLQDIKNFEPNCFGNKQVTALASLSGLTDGKTASDVIKKDGAKGFSTFMGYYSLLALQKSGNMTEALDIIKEYWGGMIQMGATTFWEEFNIEDMTNSFGIDELPETGKRDVHGDFGGFCYKGFRKSLCHGWASGPTAFLSNKVLGIVPLEAGYKKIAVCPDLGNLEWVKGSIPTPYGVIEAEHRRENGKVISKITVPDGVCIDKKAV